MNIEWKETRPLSDDEQDSHRHITRSLEQCEVWCIGHEPDTETARTHAIDALDEIKNQHNLTK